MFFSPALIRPYHLKIRMLSIDQKQIRCSGAQIYELGKTVAALDRAVRQIAEARLFSPVECAEAQELV